MGRYGRCLPIPGLSSVAKEKAKDDGGGIEVTSLTEAEIDEFLSQQLGITPADINIAVTDTHVRDELVIRDKGKETGKIKDKQELRERQALLPGADLPGFMPLREDFDTEYENDAENLLADMEFSPDDHPTERELKLQIIKIYNAKLAQRDARKRFVIDRGLVDFK